MQALDRSVTDMLTMYDHGRRSGFLTRTCYYCFIAAGNQAQTGFPPLEKLHQQVLDCKRVQDAIQMTVEYGKTIDGASSQASSSCISEHEARKKAESMAKDMIGTVTSRVIRFCGWIYLLLLKKVSRSVQFCPAQLQAIQEAASDGSPIIYMPLHYSHLDYILLSLVLFHNNVKVPYIASGNNLHLPIIGYFIKRAGGFFIRRKLDERKQKDFIYRAVLQAYITELLKSSQSLEVFLEGTRSRSGLPNVPKTGLLSVLVDAVVEKQVDDALIVPVHTSYEKLFEGNFNNELVGKSKKAESLWDTFKSVFKILFGDYGNIKINFAKPISLKTALTDICMYSSKNSSLSCLPASNQQIVNELQTRRSSSPVLDLSWRKNISYLAEHIIFHGIRCSSFMPSHLVAFLLVNRWRDGVYFEDLVASYCRLKTELTTRGRDLAFSGEPRDVVLHALSLLGEKVISLHYTDEIPLQKISGAGDATVTLASQEKDCYDPGENADSGIFISCDTDNAKNSPDGNEGSVVSYEQAHNPQLIIKPITSIPSIFELSYYSNALTPVFAIESIISLAVTAVTGFRFSMVQEQWKLNGGADIFEDSLPDSIQKSFLRSTLVEKTLELCDFLQMDLMLCDVIVDLEDCVQDTLQNLISSGCLISKTIGCSKLTHMNYGIDEEENFGDDELLKVNTQSISQLLFYQSILAPFVEALTLVTEQLGVLEKPMPQKDFLARLIEYAHNRTKNGLTTRTECCSSEVLMHCVRAFKSNKVVEAKDSDIVLTEECQNPSHLNKLLMRISLYLM